MDVFVIRINDMNAYDGDALFVSTDVEETAAEIRKWGEALDLDSKEVEGYIDDLRAGTDGFTFEGDEGETIYLDVLEMGKSYFPA